ncbi:MAG: DUF935 family protein [Acidithiobacillus sp.]|jgi:phage gp29-like protein|uniref:phage portal protein family protein n=1 Tax=Acidithiobacillus sp. TaxID=1872118 RepID=UPI00355F427F
MAREIGHIGRTQSSLFQYNLASDEYLQALTWPNYISIYEKMKRSDAQIKAMLLMLELPIRSTQWYIEPFDKSRKAKKAAEFVEQNLFEGPPIGMSVHWDDLLRNICTMFAFGHSVFEKVYKVDKDGYLKWRKFAPRPQATIYDFLYDDNGGPKGVIQTLYNKGFEKAEIPIDKLLIFSHRAENGDIRGSSALRAPYKHWMIKDFLYKIMNIGIERNHVGTPIIKLPAGATDDDIERAEKIVTTLRSADLGGATIPEGFLLELFEGKRNMVDILPYLQHQDLMIARSALCQFINLGSTETGSFALSKDQSDMFLMMLNAEAKYICNVFNSYAIPSLIKYNFNTDQFPYLCFKPLGGNDSKLFETLKLLTDGGLVVPDKNIEEWLRDMLELPEKSKDEDIYTKKESNKDNTSLEKEYTEEKDVNDSLKDDSKKEDDKNEESTKQSAKQAKTDNDDEKEKNLTEPTKQYWRERKPEEEGINFEEIEAGLDSLENAFKEDGKVIISKIVKDLSERVQMTEPSKIAAIPVRYKGELTSFIYQYMNKSVDFGANTQSPLQKPLIDTNGLKTQASIIANNIAERVKSRFLFNYTTNLVNDVVINAAKKAERMMLK